MPPFGFDNTPPYGETGPWHRREYFVRDPSQTLGRDSITLNEGLIQRVTSSWIIKSVLIIKKPCPIVNPSRQTFYAPGMPLQAGE
jgi:hypothetical protein